MSVPVLEVGESWVAESGVRVWVARDDLGDPAVPGNKRRKLKHNLVAAREQGHHTILTFGGAYSNHLRATAAAGRRHGLRTIGVVRGEEHLPLNESLARAAADGMRLSYLDRFTYRRKTEPAVLAGLTAEFGRCYLLPEGGSNGPGVRGCAELPAELDLPFDVLCCACGTGGTLAGIAGGLTGGQRALGFAVLKGAEYLDGEVRRLQREAFGAATGNWTIAHDAHFGGYTKRPPELTAFAADFLARHGIALDPVYEAKLLHGLFAHVHRGEFAPGTRVVAVLS